MSEENKKLNEHINEFFNNDELMSNIRSGIVLFFALGLGFLYFGLYSSIDFGALLSFKTAGLTMTALLSNWVWRIDLEIRAFQDELRDNLELTQIETDIQEESNTFDDYENALEFVKDWNERQQDMFNLLKTEARISVLNQAIKYSVVRKKRWWHKKFLFINLIPSTVKEMTEEIERLEINPLIDKSFKPITVNQLISVQKIKKNKERKGQDSIQYDPKRDGTKKSLVFSLFKFLGIGGSGGIAFGIIDEPGTIVIFYLMLLITLALTTFNRYRKVRKNTKTTYFMTRKNKLKLIREMKEFKAIKKLIAPKEETFKKEDVVEIKEITNETKI